MKRRAFLFYRLAIIASVSISSVIWARPKGDVWVGNVPLCQAKE